MMCSLQCGHELDKSRWVKNGDSVDAKSCTKCSQMAGMHIIYPYTTEFFGEYMSRKSPMPWCNACYYDGWKEGGGLKLFKPLEIPCGNTVLLRKPGQPKGPKLEPPQVVDAWENILAGIAVDQIRLAEHNAGAHPGAVLGGEVKAADGRVGIVARIFEKEKGRKMLRIVFADDIKAQLTAEAAAEPAKMAA